MEEPIRLLLIEDSADDAELIVRALEREGHAVTHRRVETEATLREALRGRWDLVISDFSMPRFDGLKAHEIVHNQDPLVPFIFVSGVLGEERAVEAMRAGATDYVLKGNLRRLPPVVERALADRENRRQRMAAEQALALQRRRFQSIFEAAPVALMEVDLAGARRLLDVLGDNASPERLGNDHELLARLVRRVRVLAANQATARMVGARDTNALLGPRRLRPGAAAMWLDVFDLLRGEGGEFARETTLVGEDGVHREVLLSARVPATRTELRNVVVSMVDVTERNSLERQMRAAQRLEAVGRLAGGVAHDFNNVLTVIRGYTELVAAALEVDDPVRADLANIEAAATSAELLTRQLLEFGRQQNADPVRLDLNEHVSRIESMLRRVLGDDVHLTVFAESELWPVRMDPTSVDQVLMNLAVNARDAMPRGGSLVIETANEPARSAGEQDRVVLVVTDTGDGMDAEVREMIFEPFFTTKEPGRGTGLGLSTVHRIVTEAGGRVNVESQPGSGTTFRILLPSADEQASDPERRQDAGPPQGSEEILLVESDRLVGETARRILERAGFRVLMAGNAREALDLAARHEELAALITSAQLPDMEGTELARQIGDLGRRLRVLLVSDYAAVAAAPDRAGLSRVAKPYTAAGLLEALRELLEGP